MGTPIELLQRRTGRVVEAELLDASEIDFVEQRRQWEPWLACYRRLGDQGDAGWDWGALFRDEQSLVPSTQCFAIRTRGLYQGMMILGSIEQSNLSHPAPDRLVYVNYLASAPWNRGDFRTRRRQPAPIALSGIGLFFILYAIQTSRAQGHGGRIGLHALENAIEFYVRACHFTFVGTKVLKPDPPYPWLELPAVSAAFLVRKTT